MSEDLTRCQRRLERERRARQEAESLLEQKSRELYEANNELKQLTTTLEQRVEQRTRELDEARAAAEQANHTKTQFLANISHEVRTPLNAIIGYAELLTETDSSSAQRQHAARVIRTNSEHLLGIVNDVLDISKIEAGEMSVEIVTCDPWQLTSEVASAMRVKASEKNLTFEVIHRPPLPERIRTDPTRLRQVLMNLTNNAIKFTETGVVRLIVELVAPDADGHQKLAFHVADSGMGIEPDKLDELFQPFRQADVSRSREHGGTGLGLSISKQLTQRLGGDLVAESKLGLGSIFTATINPGSLHDVPLIEQPMQEAGREPRPEGASAGPSSSLSGRILLCEDGRHNRELIRLFLEQAGATVTEAENGQVGVQRFREASEQGEGFDLVLMDMQMPKVDGYEATRQMQTVDQRVPIVALTAHAMTGDRERCLSVGCCDYLSKPIKRDTLVRTLGTHLRQPAGPDPGGSGKDASPTHDADQPRAEQAPPHEDGLDETVLALRPRFVADLPRHVAEIEQAANQQARESLREQVHTLKGTAGTYGFPRIAELAGELQHALENDAELASIHQQLQQLLDLVRSVDGYMPHKETCAME